ncbi:hypothetical protein C0Q70_13110 [Pomacea canaliculata]|uniref:EF-hand domain-containing protein n=2 Tax=Pomacea canaliculata TaxID=400727 RepID=A0A2T7NWB5_POMCA|nr:hypothetical protein C0Q70_13110 [Pomacea canaliculata]
MQQPPTSFHDPNVVGNQEHLREHLKNEININKDLSPEEMEFHYFRLHDSNNDTLLDGQEIMKALTHMMQPPELMPFEMQGKTAPDIAKLKKERYLQFMQGIVQVVDKVLETDDVDKDGYLTYPEYIVARRRDAKQMLKMQQEMLRQAEAYRQQQAELANKPKEALL